MHFLLDQLLGVLQRRAHIFGGDAILTCDFFTRHATRQTTQDAGHGHARASNHRFAVLNFGVDNDSLVHGRGPAKPLPASGALFKANFAIVEALAVALTNKLTVQLLVLKGQRSAFSARQISLDSEARFCLCSGAGEAEQL
jgi:hypothetical protein